MEPAEYLSKTEKFSLGLIYDMWIKSGPVVSNYVEKIIFEIMNFKSVSIL